jgi:AraC family transcriptional regulator
MMARNHGEVKSFARITIKSILEGMNLMQERIKQRGYTVGNVGSVYLTSDMDKTIKWFEEVLGWYADVEARDDNGNPTYGCAMPFNGELVHLGVASFNGVFLLPGETPKCLISMMGVKNIDNLYNYVKKSGWKQITEITEEAWGARACNITTVDGCVLRFFE